MPFFISRKIEKHGNLGIWQITESLDELKNLFDIPAKDLSLMNSFSNENRKKEYLAARILLEKLTRLNDMVGQVGKNKAVIVYNEHGIPFLENSKMHISVSHAHHLLAVILDTHKTGIDIERINPKILRIKEKFMNAEELNSVQKKNELEQLTVFWCAKETLYKWHGKGGLRFKENLLIEPFLYKPEGIIKCWIKTQQMEKSFHLWHEELKVQGIDYMMTYPVNED